MFSAIVCPVDFSEHSLRALRYAIALAGYSHARVTVVHVTDPLLAQAAAAFDLAALNKETESELWALTKRIVDETGGYAPRVRIDISSGESATEIIRRALAERADAIVMGTHGLSGYRKMLFGSVTERVLRHSSIPVLAVPSPDPEQDTSSPGTPLFKLGPVLAPIDFGDGSLADARVAHELARRFDAPLLLVHVVTAIRATDRWQKPIEARERIVLAQARHRLEQLATDLGGGSIETHIAVGSPADEIASIAVKRNAGLVVMGLRGLLGARPGTTAYRVLCLAQTPVLALPALTAAPAPPLNPATVTSNVRRSNS